MVFRHHSDEEASPRIRLIFQDPTALNKATYREGQNCSGRPCDCKTYQSYPALYKFPLSSIAILSEQNLKAIESCPADTPIVFLLVARQCGHFLSGRPRRIDTSAVFRRVDENYNQAGCH